MALLFDSFTSSCRSVESGVKEASEHAHRRLTSPWRKPYCQIENILGKVRSIGVCVTSLQCSPKYQFEGTRQCDQTLYNVNTGPTISLFRDMKMLQLVVMDESELLLTRLLFSRSRYRS